MAMTNQEKDFFRRPEASFTMKGRIFYADILAVGRKGNYSVLFAWHKNDNAQEFQRLQNFITQGLQTFHPGLNQQALVNPVKFFDTYVRTDGKQNADFLKDCFWINMASGAVVPPSVFKNVHGIGPVACNPDSDRAEVYSGRNAVVSFSFYNLRGEEGKRRGLSANVNAVLLLEGGAHEGGQASIDANAVFGSFMQDMGQQSAPAQNYQQAPAQNYQQAPQQQYAPPAPAQQYAPPAPQQQYAPQAPQQGVPAPAYNPNAPYNPNGQN